MGKTKYFVTGGFLGAGKTTSTIAFADAISKKHGTPAIIANDLGARDIVDSLYTSTTDYFGDQVVGGCICFKTDELVYKIGQLAEKGADVVLSDIPGCGVGALGHIYGSIDSQYPGTVEFAPFTIVVDPARLVVLQDRADDVHLPDSIAYILNTQLTEANLIVLNKVDTLTDEERERDIAFIESRYPGKPVFSMSARTGEGVEAVVDYIMTHEGTVDVTEEDIDYRGEAMMAAMSTLSWFNRRTLIKTRGKQPIDFNEVVSFLVEQVRDGLRANERNSPHLKFFGTGNEQDFVKGSMVGIDEPISFDRKLDAPCPKLSFVLNARSTCESELMLDIVDDAYDATYEKFDLKGQVYYTECWGLRDDSHD